MSFLNKKSLLKTLAAVMIVLGLQSCGSNRSYLVIPHSVSTASAVTIDELNLKPGDYSILQSITETASVTCEYRNDEIRVNSGDGDFTYTFKLNPKSGWFLKSFSGAAALGYFSNDYTAEPAEMPNVEEFARRVAMAQIINAARDYGADAVIEPICVTKTSNAGNNKIEYTCTVTAKLIEIKEQ